MSENSSHLSRWGMLNRSALEAGEAVVRSQSFFGQHRGALRGSGRLHLTTRRLICVPFIATQWIFRARELVIDLGDVATVVAAVGPRRMPYMPLSQHFPRVTPKGLVIDTRSEGQLDCNPGVLGGRSAEKWARSIVLQKEKLDAT